MPKSEFVQPELGPVHYSQIIGRQQRQATALITNFDGGPTARLVVSARRSDPTDVKAAVAIISHEIAPDRGKPHRRVASDQVHVRARTLDEAVQRAATWFGGEMKPDSPLAHLRTRIRPAQPLAISV